MKVPRGTIRESAIVNPGIGLREKIQHCLKFGREILFHVEQFVNREA